MCQFQEVHLYVIITYEILPGIFSEVVYTCQEMQKQILGDTKILNAIFSLETKLKSKQKSNFCLHYVDRS